MTDQSLTHKDKVEQHKSRLGDHLKRCNLPADIIDVVFSVVDIAYAAGEVDGERNILDKMKAQNEAS